MKTPKHVSFSYKDGRTEITPHLYEATINAEIQIIVHSKGSCLWLSQLMYTFCRSRAVNLFSSSEFFRKYQYLNLGIKLHLSNTANSAPVKIFSSALMTCIYDNLHCHLFWNSDLVRRKAWMVQRQQSRSSYGYSNIKKCQVIQIPIFQWIRSRGEEWVSCLFCWLRKELFSYIQVRSDIQISDDHPWKKKWIEPLNVSWCLQRNFQIKWQTILMKDLKLMRFSSLSEYTLRHERKI